MSRFTHYSAARGISVAVSAFAVLGLVNAAPRLEKAAFFTADNGANAVVWIDLNSVIRAQHLTRAWTITDYSEFQVGEWYAEPGVSKAFMSSRQFTVVDCATKDVGWGSWAALDGRRGDGTVVHSVTLPVPTKADQPVAPGTVGDAVSEAICKQRR